MEKHEKKDERKTKERRKNIFFCIKIISLICLIVLALPVGLALHEGSHMLTLCLCNGTFDGISFGTQSYVGGYVDPKYISLVSMSSIFIPLIVSVILSMIRSIHLLSFNLGLTIQTVVNITFGLFATAFVHNDLVRETYDVALAYDYSMFPSIVVIASVLCLFIQLFFVCWQIKRCNKKIDNYLFK